MVPRRSFGSCRLCAGRLLVFLWGPEFWQIYRNTIRGINELRLKYELDVNAIAYSPMFCHTDNLAVACIIK